MVVLFLDYFPGQNLFLVFFDIFKNLKHGKKEKNGQRYHYSINRKVEMLNFAAKYCERTQRKCSDRKMVKLIEKELGYCVSHQTFGEWRKNQEQILKSYSMDKALVRVRDNQLRDFEDYLDSEFRNQMLKCSLTQGLANRIYY